MASDASLDKTYGGFRDTRPPRLFEEYWRGSGKIGERRLVLSTRIGYLHYDTLLNGVLVPEINVFLESLNDPQITPDGIGRLLFYISKIFLKRWHGSFGSVGD